MSIRRNLAIVGFLILTAPAEAAEWTKKQAGATWTWFEDYIYAYATYIVACEPRRECQVGMGIFAFGEPRGETIRFSGEREVTVVGIGSLHIRVLDGGGPAQVAILQKSTGLISIPSVAW